MRNLTPTTKLAFDNTTVSFKILFSVVGPLFLYGCSAGIIAGNDIELFDRSAVEVGKKKQSPAPTHNAGLTSSNGSTTYLKYPGIDLPNVLSSTGTKVQQITHPT